MHSWLTIAIQLVLLGLCVWYWLGCTWRVDEAHGWYLKAEAVGLKLRAERDRVTTLERELDTLRRQLQKLTGKFYAAQRELEQAVDEQVHVHEARATEVSGLAVCENWLRAKLDGPSSPAASCECDYCVAAREARRNFRQSVVPKIARAQGDLAKLNASR